jgi:hypothetical protein
MFTPWSQPTGSRWRSRLQWAPSNSQLKGQYAGINSGGCLVAISGFDQNDRPIDPTKSYSTVVSDVWSIASARLQGEGRGSNQLYFLVFRTYNLFDDQTPVAIVIVCVNTIIGIVECDYAPGL